jgi:hydroxymethylpyrimidine pyrophosphatase-like HAD family hydrolase
VIVYTDLDGTMLGPRGSFFHAPDRSITLEPAIALADFLAAGNQLVLVSGRTRPQLIEAAAIFGADGYIGELGSLVGWDGPRECVKLEGTGPAADDDLVEELLADFAGRLEFHEPWHLGHEVDVMLRGNIPPEESRAWLDAHGVNHLDLRDNGVLPPARPTGLASSTMPVHVYHLLPQGISKGHAVAWDLRRRQIDPKDAVAVGDSTSDLEMAGQVGQFFLVANGATHVRRPLPDNVTITKGAQGLGWAEAVRANSPVTDKTLVHTSDDR